MSKDNNKLIALVFDDPYKADEARAAVNRMGGEGLLEIDETAVIVKKADGKVRVSQDVNVVGRDQQIGHIAGLVTAAVTGTFHSRRNTRRQTDWEADRRWNHERVFEIASERVAAKHFGVGRICAF